DPNAPTGPPASPPPRRFSAAATTGRRRRRERLRSRRTVGGWTSRRTLVYHRRATMGFERLVPQSLDFPALGGADSVLPDRARRPSGRRSHGPDPRPRRGRRRMAAVPGAKGL